MIIEQHKQTLIGSNGKLYEFNQRCYRDKKHGAYKPMLQ